MDLMEFLDRPISDLPMPERTTITGRVPKRYKTNYIAWGALIMITISAVAFIVIAMTVFPNKSTGDQNQIQCKDGWKKVQNKCYLFGNACIDGCRFNFSSQYCKNLGARLAEPTDQKVLEELMDIGRNDARLRINGYWLGLKREEASPNFRWIADDRRANIDKRFWNVKEPSFDGPLIHMEKETMLLNDRRQPSLVKPICEKKINRNGNPNPCDNGWFNYKTFCYKFLVHNCINKCNYEVAREQCSRLDSILAENSITFLTSLARSFRLDLNYWIGYRDKNNTNVFTGDTTGKTLNMSMFGKDEPSNLEERCLELDARISWKINDKSCKHEKWESNLQPLCEMI